MTNERLDDTSVSRMSDTASKVAGLETRFEKMESQFSTSFARLEAIISGLGTQSLSATTVLPVAQAATYHRCVQRLTPQHRTTLAALVIKLLAWVRNPSGGKDDRSPHLSLEKFEQTRLQHTHCFGDDLPVKKKNILRIGFQNIGGFSTEPNNIKDDYIRFGLTHFDFDIFGITETNVDWRLQPEDNKLWSRTREWWEHLQISFTHNTTFPPLENRQFGGNAIFTMNETAHKVFDKGRDKSNLGRWTWTKLRGKNGHTLTIITAYRPNPPQSGVMGVTHNIQKILILSTVQLAPDKPSLKI
jgi:hypothetical protein